MNDLSLGIPGVGEIHPGTHLCALYSGPAERERLLTSFMLEGVRHGDQCVCLGDDPEPASMPPGAYGPAGPADERRWHLSRYPLADAYLRPGAWERMISLRVVYPTPSTDGQLSVLRGAGEMSWVPQEPGAQEPGAEELSDYELAVTQILADLPALFLCMYDLQRFEVGTLVEVLRIHSAVLLAGVVLHNPHSQAPTAYPKPAPDPVPRFPLARLPNGREDGGDRWLTLTGAEVRVAELVACGMTNRATAQELVVSPHTVDAHLKHMYAKLGIHSRVELAVLALQHGSSGA
ncbi:DNA-binding CsgD family transcriptional regulator [Phycicoccus badiiscoriae]|uniref:DNA-binding CsgD family transcriptional regulator n=1 Tax=Pedococcus badiiscoriae TaxID=642776 RepID=A0A852WFE9_9MICO|nr:DNA-binding CsgD family transcriptional regulator [Pedococcus badiiscoriae]